MRALLVWGWLISCAALGVGGVLGNFGCGVAAILLFVGGEMLLPEPQMARRYYP